MIYFLPAIVWAMGIFFLSSLSGSVRDPQDVDILFYIGRKGAHVVEYFVLTLFVLWGISKTKRWSRRAFWIGVSVVVFYAISDEVHQSFVPNRQGQPLDVLIDVFGVIFGSIVSLRLFRRT